MGLPPGRARSRLDRPAHDRFPSRPTSAPVRPGAHRLAPGRRHRPPRAVARRPGGPHADARRRLPWRFDPYALLWRHLAIPLVGLPSRTEAAAPHRFAKLIGATFTLAATPLVLVGGPVALAGYALAGVVAVLAGLAATTGFCVGCRLYRRFEASATGLDPVDEADSGRPAAGLSLPAHRPTVSKRLIRLN